MNCRKQFTFYKSFDDALEDMSDKQIAEYIKAMLDVQFLRVKVKDISFNDKILNFVWKSQKHSVETSIKGYLDSQKSSSVKNPYLGIYDAIQNPSEGVPQQEQVKEQVQVKEEGKVEVQKEFTFSLSTSRLLSSTSKEYKSKLEDYISNSGKAMSYEDFYNQCEMKPYKYKNFKMAYDSWNKSSKQASQKIDLSPEIELFIGTRNVAEITAYTDGKYTITNYEGKEFNVSSLQQLEYMHNNDEFKG